MAVTDPDRSAMTRVQSASPIARRKRFVARKKARAQRGDSRSADLWLMLLLLALSGNPVFVTPGVSRVFIPVLAVFFGVRVVKRKNRKHDYRVLPILGYFGIIIAVQAVHFMYFPAFTLLGLFCRFAVAYELVALISDFPTAYVRALLLLAAMAMFFFFSNLAGSAVGINLADATQHIALPVATNTGAWTFLLHSYSNNPSDTTRNAGMFWEPGAFAGYLNLALVILCLSRKRYTKRGFLMRFAILAVCLLTTQSTMGYVCFALVIFLVGISGTTGKARLMSIAATLCFLTGFVAFALNQDFIIPKIEHSILDATAQTGSWQADRLGSLIFDSAYISARPLTGWGINDATRLILDPDLQGNALIGRGNGMSDFAAKFGVPALLIWLYCLYRLFLTLSPGRRLPVIIGVVIILIALNDECFLNYPLFLSFFFLADLFRGHAVGARKPLKELAPCPQ